MKKFVFCSVTILSLFIASCAPDSKDDPTSPSNPTTDNRDKFVASWNVNENSALAGTTGHTVNITKSTSVSSDIIINNFYGITSSAVRATVSNNNISIPYQSIPGGFVIGGSGIMSNATSINLTYTTALSSDRDSCTAVYTKQ